MRLIVYSGVCVIVSCEEKVCCFSLSVPFKCAGGCLEKLVSDMTYRMLSVK